MRLEPYSTLIHLPPRPPPPQVARQQITNRAFHDQVLRLLIQQYETVPHPDWPEVAQCLMFLEDDKEVANILDRLLKGSQVRGTRLACCLFFT